MNINQHTDDIYYRYKMPELISRLCGRGNGSFTILDNINEISDTLNTPSTILLNFIARSLGSSCNDDKKTITGHYQTLELIDSIYKFIDFFVICPKCTIPELIPKIIGNKKNKQVQVSCSACGYIETLNTNNNVNNKTIDQLIKYYEKNTYTIKKGNIIEQEICDKNYTDLFNPF